MGCQPNLYVYGGHQPHVRACAFKVGPIAFVPSHMKCLKPKVFTFLVNFEIFNLQKVKFLKLVITYFGIVFSNLRAELTNL